MTKEVLLGLNSLPNKQMKLTAWGQREQRPERPHVCPRTVPTVVKSVRVTSSEL